MTAAITTVELAKRYGTRKALHEVTTSIGSGVTGLLGPNGAGKSTLLAILATVLAPSSGEVRVLGLDPSVARDRREIRRRLGYLPQQPGMYGGFTAFEMVDYMAILKEHTIRDQRHREVRRVLEQVGLEDDMHRKVRRLSGGMRQRVALATTLLGTPELLILDEPAAGLDPDQRLRFRASISAVAHRHTILVATHQTEEVAAMCDHVLVLHGGGVAFAGTPGDLVAVGEGRVWVDERATVGARRSWRTGDGLFRNIGEPPPGASLVAPTIEDGYLLLLDEPVVVHP